MIVDQEKRGVLAIGFDQMLGENSSSSSDSSGGTRTGTGKQKSDQQSSLLQGHAEAAAILRCKRSKLPDSIMYVTKFPCDRCANLIAQSGIMELVYRDEPDPADVVSNNAHYILTMSNVEIRNFKS